LKDEAAAIKKRYPDCKTLRLERKAAVDVTPIELQHPTEREWMDIPFDYSIDNNNYTVSQLYAEIDKLMQKMGVVKVN
jgi:hypothetical protein